jgi:hypothetical protein
VILSCYWRVLCTERTCNSSIAIWTRICFCSAVKKWRTYRRCRTVKLSDCVRCRRRCTVDLGRQILRESSRTDGNGNSARVVSIASSTGLRSTSGASGGVAGKLSAASIFGHRRVCHNILPKHVYKIIGDGIESHPFHPEIKYDWLLVHQATDPQRPSFASFFPRKGTGKKL